jgi:hypothetical protein
MENGRLLKFKREWNVMRTHAICLAQYMLTDNEHFPWVMCDGCKFWMHIDCIPIGVDLTPIDKDKQFFCYDCTY